MKKKLFILFVAFLNTVTGKAQAPGNVPYGEPAPLELTPANIIFFIVLPILLFVALIIIRRKKRKKSES